jgi:hypothetical protein
LYLLQRGIPTSDPMVIGGGGGGGAGEVDGPKKKTTRVKASKLKRRDVRPSSAPAGGGRGAAFGSRVPFTPASDAAVGGTTSRKSSSKRATASSKARAAGGKKKASKGSEEVRFVDIREIDAAAPSGWGGGGIGGEYGDGAIDGDAEALARAVGATLHLRDEYPLEEEEFAEEEIDDDGIVDEFLG